MNKETFVSKAYNLYDDSIVYTIADLIYKESNLTIEINKYVIHVKYSIKNVEVYFIMDYSIFGNEYIQECIINKAKCGIRCIFIFRYEIESKYFILNNIINRSLNISKEVVYARNTSIKEVSSNDTKDFLNRVHLQGWTASSINIGLYNNKELIGIMTFGKPRMNKNYEYELIRLATSSEVLGGASKLFSYFVRKYNPNSILSYCDITKFNGNVYTKLGFRADESCITAPNYVWVNQNNNVLPRYRTMKHKLLAKGLGTEEQTEDEIMSNLGYNKVYNAGNIKFEWRKPTNT